MPDAATIRFPEADYPHNVAVSAVISVWNRSEFLADALVSVRDQSTDAVVETVIVDDGSYDSSFALAIAWAEQNASPRRPVTLVARPHQGIAPTVRAGIAAARGEYVAHLASDDMWRPDRVQRALDALEAYGRPAAVFTDFSVVDSDLAEVLPDGLASMGWTGMPPVLSDGAGDVAAAWWRYRQVMGGALLLIPRDWLSGPAQLPADAPEEDYWFSLVAFLAGPVLFISEPTYTVRGHAGQETRRRQLEGVGNEEAQRALLREQIALVAADGRQPRVLTALRIQEATVVAKQLRDAGRTAAAMAALMGVAPQLLTWPQATGRWLMRLGYCVSPALYGAVRQRRWR